MIKIRGKEFSEETIVEALQKHCNFEEKKYILQAGDVVVNSDGQHRVIVGYVQPIAYNLSGNRMSEVQSEFEYFGYKKIGTLTDFIKN